MSAIAYITDSKMLELHRLNNHRTINFWRPSGNINFTEFGEGDLLFFCFLANLMRSQCHSHSHSGIRPCTLRYHIGDSLSDLFIISTLDKLFLRENASVKNTDFAVFIPCHIFVSQQERHAFIEMFQREPLLSDFLKLPAENVGQLKAASDFIPVHNKGNTGFDQYTLQGDPVCHIGNAGYLHYF